MDKKSWVKQMLKLNNTLEVMSLKCSNFDINWPRSRLPYPTNLCVNLFQALAHLNCSLKKLTLSVYSTCFLDPSYNQVMAALTEMLSHNTSLTAVNLIHSNVFPGLLEAVANGIGYNTSLSKLCVKGSPISSTDNELVVLFQALTQNSSLEKVVLDFDLKHHMGLFLLQGSFSKFAELLIHNISLTSVTITCDFTKTQLQQVARSLVLNFHRNEMDLILGEDHLRVCHVRPDGTIKVNPDNLSKRVINPIMYCEFIQGEVIKYKQAIAYALFTLYRAYWARY